MAIPVTRRTFQYAHWSVVNWSVSVLLIDVMAFMCAGHYVGLFSYSSEGILVSRQTGLRDMDMTGS